MNINQSNTDLLALLGGLEGIKTNAKGENTSGKGEFEALLSELGVGVDVPVGLEEKEVKTLLAKLQDQSNPEVTVESHSENILPKNTQLQVENTESDLLNNLETAKTEAPLRNKSNELDFLLAKNNLPKNTAKVSPVDSEAVIKQGKIVSPEKGELPKTKVQSSEDFVNQLQMMKKNTIAYQKDSGDIGVVRPMQNTAVLGMSAYKKGQNQIDENIIKFPTAHKTEVASINKLEGSLVEEVDTSAIDLMSSAVSSKQAQSGGINLGLNMSESGEGVKSQSEVLDLGNMKVSNSSQIVQKVVNYIEQKNIANSDSIDLLVKHDELGLMKITAQKAGVTGGQVNLEIQAQTEAGHKFFVDNEAELIKSLNNSGIKLSNIKITNSVDTLIATSDSKMSGDQNFSHDKGQSFSQQQSSSQFNQQGSSRDGSQRRQELWQQYREQMQQSA